MIAAGVVCVSHIAREGLLPLMPGRKAQFLNWA